MGGSKRYDFLKIQIIKISISKEFMKETISCHFYI
jgi:hypothetical protein